MNTSNPSAPMGFSIGAALKIIPTVGRVVYVKLSEQDCTAINKRREDFSKNNLENWQLGSQAHVGNRVEIGEVCAAIIVKVWSETTINAKVLLDGNDDFWATSLVLGEGEHQWDWMPFQKNSASNSQSAEPRPNAN